MLLEMLQSVMASHMTGLLSRLKDGTAFQLRFRDRKGAEVLANTLKFLIKRAKEKGSSYWAYLAGE